MKRDEFGYPEDVAGIALLEVDQRTGWAVFTGCEGEVADFHSFFASRADAEAYVALCADPDADHYMTDPGIAPAVIVDGRIVAADNLDYVSGAGALLRAADIHHGKDHDRLLREAARAVDEEDTGGKR